MTKQQTHCPCDAQNLYATCCGRFLDGQMVPDSAQALMRSRYTAYTLGKIEFIQKTMCGPAAKNFNPVDAKRWASNAQWKRLKILRDFPHPTAPDRHYVEFVADYIAQNKKHRLQELSEFQRIDGHWFYVDGQMK